MDDRPLRLGTRGSQLARRQAETVANALESHRFDVTLHEVTTTGDTLDTALIHQLGKTGAFVRDLDERVLSGELDAAVHSLKDMPTEMPNGLIVAAIPERAPVGDVLVTPTGTELADLPRDAIVGTGSLRRQAQIQRTRDDLRVEPVRGNVDTRLEKVLAPFLQREREELDEQDEESLEEWIAERTAFERRAMDREVETAYDALVLAEAGLRRAALTDHIGMVPLPVDQFVPAPGQGAIAVVMRDEDDAKQVHRRLDHPPSRVACTVERTILSTLGGGCIAPIGVLGMVQGSVVRTRAQILGRDGTEVVETTRELPIEDHLEEAVSLAEDLARQGATELIAASKRTAGAGPDPP